MLWLRKKVEASVIPFHGGSKHEQWNWSAHCPQQYRISAYFGPLQVCSSVRCARHRATVSSHTCHRLGPDPCTAAQLSCSTRLLVEGRSKHRETGPSPQVPKLLHSSLGLRTAHERSLLVLHSDDAGADRQTGFLSLSDRARLCIAARAARSLSADVYQCLRRLCTT